MKSRATPPQSHLLEAGDVIVFGDPKKTKAEVVNLLWVNKQPGVQLSYPGQMCLSDRFQSLETVEALIRAGVWTLRKRKAKRANGGAP